MKNSDWIDRWSESRIGFHEGTANAALVSYAEEWGVGAGRRILIPLCGKSVDIQYLATRGCEVVGVELATLAVEQFFATVLNAVGSP